MVHPSAFSPPRSLSDLEMGVTADEFAGGSPPEADLRVILGFQVP